MSDDFVLLIIYVMTDKTARRSLAYLMTIRTYLHEYEIKFSFIVNSPIQFIKKQLVINYLFGTVLENKH